MSQAEKIINEVATVIWAQPGEVFEGYIKDIRQQSSVLRQYTVKQIGNAMVYARQYPGRFGLCVPHVGGGTGRKRFIVVDENMNPLRPDHKDCIDKGNVVALNLALSTIKNTRTYTLQALANAPDGSIEQRELRLASGQIDIVELTLSNALQAVRP